MKIRSVYFLSIGIFAYLTSSLYAQEQPKFKVGVIAPLSGALSEYGVASKNGIETAIAEHPESFKNIQFIFEDSQWDPKTALNAFIKLTQVDKVNLVYNWGNPTSEAIAPVAERSKIPFLAMSLDESISKNKEYTIRAINRADDFSLRLAEEINKSEFRNIGVILADNTYVRGLFNGLKKYLSKNIQVEEIASYPIQEQDFKSGIVKIRSKKYDYIGVFLISGQISSFYKQLRQQGVKTPTFGTDFFESSTEIKLAEGGMEGAIYPHLGVDPEFYSKYVAKYNNDYQIAYAGNAYDMAIVMGNLFSDSGSLNLSSAEIIDKFKTVSNVSGIGGVFSFMNTPENGPHFHYDVQLKIIENGKIKEID
jgi:branched-chain amino acid transport system substrate-binding protein